ncbi:MAG: CDP-diacylglycerol--glycerol-3-phosphate 3-phosphatidyltransferase [Desulfatiglans sp.]|jgi:CDP-diacylglycerol--glycerol-3-phosphate 3-phosphatidyltransferase|nr:CDP-diacylglycerol--glycerol-3-phosphate 3-phosphatidyltransferase [Thermodesulfobacteriota bacterium]MEE4352078.1 CDP-diacylglycerol--glycerol-3-phosphate 3-phosphatidyltransferase [Desulfatiglans sp.]
MESKSHKDKSNLPNILSFIRLACIPFILFFLYFGGRWTSFLAALFFGIASITDLLDGYFARRYSSVTVLGKFLDPLADKLLISATMIMLIPMERIPTLVVIIIIAREMAVTGLRAIAVNEGIIIHAKNLGKQKTIFQSVSLVCLCLHFEYFQVDLHIVGMFFLCIALVLTLWSGWDYFRQFYHVFKTRKPSK